MKKIIQQGKMTTTCIECKHSTVTSVLTHSPNNEKQYH